MNNDLISREALKKAISEATYSFEQIPIRVDKVQEIIDNAPRVEVGYLTNCANCARVEKIRAKRPTGEWIKHIDNLFPADSTQECSFCHAEQRIVGNDDNFCPNCGADMRKGGAK